MYGPTQAHYQYQRQYGRPWHGLGGNTATVTSGDFYFSGICPNCGMANKISGRFNEELKCDCGTVLAKFSMQPDWAETGPQEP